MKTIKKALCMLLVLVMVFSAVSVGAVAASDVQFEYTNKYHTTRDDKISASLVLNEVDKILEQEGMREEVDLKVKKIVIDLKSINGLCDTLDLLRDYLVSDNILDAGIVAGVKAALGDLGDDINFSTWKTGMSRGSQDLTIIKEFVEFANANSGVVSGIISNNNGNGYSLGVLDSFVNINDLLGADGISGIVKETLFGIVSDDEAFYNQYKNNVDAFVYGPLLQKITGEYLPGFTMDAASTVEDLICAGFNAVLDEYVIKLIREIDIDLANEDIDVLKALAPYLNLRGSSYDFTSIKLDASKALIPQLNNLIGNICKQIVPSYTWQESEDWTKISDNLEGVLRYIATSSGVIENVASKSLDELVMEVISIILNNVDLGELEENVKDCDTLEEVAKAVLITGARDMGITYDYKESDNYLVVMGDIIGAFMYDNFNITDNSGKPYRAGKGDDLWTVLNNVLNYFLFEEGVNGYIALGTKKETSFFDKVDAIIDYFGKTKKEGVSFNSKTFLLGDGKTKKGLLDSLFTLDLENVLAITVVPALNTAGNVPVAEFIYNSLKNLLNNWSGTDMVPQYIQGSAFTNLLSNNGIANFVKDFLSVLNSRIDSTTTLLMFATTFILKGETPSLGSATVTVSDSVCTGNVISPTVTVKIGNTTLKQNTDYIAYTDSKEVGPATATIKGIGLYKGEAQVPFKIVFGKINNLTAKCNTTDIELSWNAVAGADRYNVYVNDVLKATVTGTTKSFAKIASGVKSFKFSVEAVKDGVATSEKATITAYTVPGKVSSFKASSKTTSSLKLSWTAISGVKGYKLEQKVSGKWKEIADIKDATSYTVKSLSPYTNYEFRIRAYVVNNGSNNYGAYSGTLAERTALGNVADLKASAKTSATVSLSWSKITNATGYTVYRSTDNKNWTKLASTSSTSYKAEKLSANTKYYFKVAAYSNATGSDVYSEANVISVYTNLAKATNLAVKSQGATSIKLSWSKVSGATSYTVYKSTDNKKWTKDVTVEGTSATVSSLSNITKYYFKVVPYSSSRKAYGDESAVVTAYTTVAKTSGLKASSKTSSAVTLSWSKVAKATGYTVYRSTDNKNWTKLGTTTSTSYKATKLNAKTKYYFKVAAYSNASGSNVHGEAISISAYTNLAKTSKLTVKSQSATSVKLSWSKVSGATNYTIYRSTDKKTWTKAATVEGTSATIKSLSNGTKYYFKVVAYSSSIKTYSDDSAIVTAYTTVGKVANLKASAKTSKTVTLKWDKVKGATGYTVYKSTDNKKWSKLGTTTSTTYKVEKLSAKTKYYFKVVAYSNATGSVVNGAASSISAYTNLVKTSKLTVKSQKATSVALTWSKVSGATEYIVYKSTDKKTWTKACTVKTTSATVKSLSSGTKYFFKVVPYSSSIKTNGDASSIVTAYTTVGKVTGLKTNLRTGTSIKLSWSKTTGAAGYTVYKSTDGKKWTKVGTTSSTTYTVNKLSRNTTYYFKVSAYSKATGKTVSGAYSSNLTAKTTVI